MNYEHQSKDIFQKIIECLNSVKEPNRIHFTRLCLLCRNFEEVFSRWRNCANDIGSNELDKFHDFELSIKSTLAYDFLQIAYDERYQWFCDYLKNSKHHQEQSLLVE
ncbi:MAG: hypothetical protein HRT87_02555 [Legionellales bacterium]|nr:hypothetical protein [Legionellales bacterium]